MSILRQQKDFSAENTTREGNQSRLPFKVLQIPAQFSFPSLTLNLNVVIVCKQNHYLKTDHHVKRMIAVPNMHNRQYHSDQISDQHIANERLSGDFSGLLTIVVNGRKECCQLDLFFYLLQYTVLLKDQEYC